MESAKLKVLRKNLESIKVEKRQRVQEYLEAQRLLKEAEKKEADMMDMIISELGAI